MVPWTEAATAIHESKPRAVMLSGGPRSVYESGAPDFDFSLISNIPCLGICYSHQLMAHRLGGQIERGTNKEYGPSGLTSVDEGALVGGLASGEVWMSHGDRVT